MCYNLKGFEKMGLQIFFITLSVCMLLLIRPVMRGFACWAKILEFKKNTLSHPVDEVNKHDIL